MARDCEAELLSFLKLFKKQQLLSFSYEKKGNNWSLFLHFPNGVIQISGKRKSRFEDVVYVSPIRERIPWQYDRHT